MYARFSLFSLLAANHETVSNYILYLEEANLLHRAERYNIKSKDIILGTCKYYVNDLAFHNYLHNGICFDFSPS